jgi:hypothetical protein
MPIFLSLNSQTSSNNRFIAICQYIYQLNSQTIGSNRFIAICRYNFTQKDNMDNLLKHHLITRVKNESE